MYGLLVLDFWQPIFIFQEGSWAHLRSEMLSFPI
jgi:hypothetical protein